MHSIRFSQAEQASCGYPPVFHTRWPPFGHCRPVVAHNRAWDRNNVYAKQNGGTYSFVLGNTSKGEPLGLPLERRFWDDLLQNAREWGCINYQQGETRDIC